MVKSRKSDGKRKPLRMHKDGNTCVLWDLEDYPISDIGLDPCTIYKTFKEALESEGYKGKLSIMAFVDDDYDGKFSADQYEQAGIEICPYSKGLSRLGKDFSISVHLVNCALKNIRQSNLIVLRRQSDRLFYDLHDFYRRGYGVRTPDSQPAGHQDFLTGIITSLNGELKIPDTPANSHVPAN